MEEEEQEEDRDAEARVDGGGVRNPPSSIERAIFPPPGAPPPATLTPVPIDEFAIAPSVIDAGNAPGAIGGVIDGIIIEGAIPRPIAPPRNEAPRPRPPRGPRGP